MVTLGHLNPALKKDAGSLPVVAILFSTCFCYKNVSQVGEVNKCYFGM
jgi:hypothetical protein